MTQLLRHSGRTVRAVLVLTLLGLNGCGMRQLQGTVVTTNNQPIENCTVSLKVGTSGGLRQNRSTDADGKFSFGSVTTLGGCAVSVEKPGFVKREMECPPDGNPMRVVLQSSDDINRRS